jgi:hypothetical protein
MKSVGAACQRCRLCSNVGREARLEDWDFKADLGESPVPHGRIAKQVALPHFMNAIGASHATRHDSRLAHAPRSNPHALLSVSVHVFQSLIAHISSGQIQIAKVEGSRGLEGIFKPGQTTEL